jgi:uroporphyrinogen decarboxylase
MYNGLMDDVRTSVELGVPKRVPVFALSEEFDVKWYGKYEYEATCQDAGKIAETWAAAAEEFDYDWLWVQVDDCFEFEPLGIGCYGQGNILRATKDYLPPARETLRKLRVPDPQRDGRMPVKLDAIGRLRRRFGDRACIVGSNAGPFSSASLLFGLTQTLEMVYSDPGLLKEAIDFFVELQMRWGIAQLRAGAHAIWLGDCTAMSNLISTAHYREFAFEPCRKVVAAFKDAGGLVFLHNSEESVPHLEILARLGVSAINVGPGIDIGRAKEIVKGKTCLMGNLEPISLLMNGTPGQVAAEAERIMRTGKADGGFMFNTGEMNPRDVPAANMRAMIAAAKKYASY